MILSLLCAPLAFWACDGDSTSANDNDPVEESSSSSDVILSGGSAEVEESSSSSGTKNASSSSESVRSSSSVNASLLGKPNWAYLNPEIDYDEMTDIRDGQVYKTVKINDQLWMAENLNYADSIKSPSLKGSSWCYKNSLDSCAKYGRLYTWASAIDSLCPSGWHLPSYEEWNTLIYAKSGSWLRSSSNWAQSRFDTKIPDGDSFNGSGFTALPAGDAIDGTLFDVGKKANFWSVTEYDDETRYVMGVDYEYDMPLLYHYTKTYGMSVRCLSSNFPEISNGEMTDARDGQVYKTVKIDNQEWMAENLNYAYKQPTAELDSSSFCYDNSVDSCAKYGRLYLWSAAMDSAAVFSSAGKGCGYEIECSASGIVRGVCPEGWHLPNEAEWKALFVIAGGIKTAGKKLKSTSGWNSEGNGTDAFRFSVLPGGLYQNNGDFGYIGEGAQLWSSSEVTPDQAYYMFFRYNEEYIDLYNNDKRDARSVRCLKD